MKWPLLLIFSCVGLIFYSSYSFAQVGIGTTAPSPNAVLELKAPGSNQGFLVPRLTTAQRTAATFISALSAVEKGLLVFDTDVNGFYYWNGSAWTPGNDNLGAVLSAGNNAGAQSATNFSAISINRTDVHGALNVNGAHYTGFTALAAVPSYTVASGDYLIIGTATAGIPTDINLPEASTCIGRILILRGRSVGGRTVAGVRAQAAAGDTIDGVSTSPYLTPVTANLISITIVAISDSEWITISKTLY